MTADRRLVAYRTFRGWASRRVYSEVCGVSCPTLWKIEAGGSSVRRRTLERYGDPLGLTVDQVILLRPGSSTSDMFEMRPVLLAAPDWSRLAAAAAAAGESIDRAISRAVARHLEMR